MPRQITNRSLLLLVPALALSGLAAWWLPLAAAWPLYDLHRALGAALLLTLGWKYGIARRSLRRRVGRTGADPSVLPGLGTGLLVLGSVGLGLAWTLGLVSFDTFGGYSALNLHVYLGLAALAPLLWHLARRWERAPRPGRLFTRRSVVRLLGLGLGSVLGWRLIETAADAAGGQARRPTGSKHAGSFTGNAHPVTNWLFDPIPPLARDAWRLTVVSPGRGPDSLGYADLDRLPPAELTAILDCTGGWWTEQTWRGWSVGDVLAAAGLDRTDGWASVVSVTGHRQTFPLAELRGALLASHVGGGPLTPGQIEAVRAWIAAGAKDDSAMGEGVRGGAAGADRSSSPSAGPAGVRRAGASRVLAFAGKFHPVVVHFPIALLMLGALAEAMALSGRAWAAQAARLCVPLGVAAAVLATVLGLLSATFGGYATATIWTHRLLGILATVLGVVALALRPAYEDPSSQAATRRGLYRLGLLAAAALTGLAGHYGGVIVHGEDHFAF